MLGMHRSGTSATAGALAQLGLYMGSALVPAAEDNPEGFFEHAAAVEANNELLFALERSWQDVRALPGGWRDGDAAAACGIRIRNEVLPDLRGHGGWALKDPRLCRTLPLWRRELEAAGVRAAALLVLRHPDEVAASLRRRDALPAEISHLLWLRHVLESVQGSEGLPRAVLDFASLLEKPQAVMARALEALGIQLRRAAGDALSATVKTGLRHHVGEAEGSGGRWRALAVQLHHGLLADPAAAGTVVAALLPEFDAAVAAETDWIEDTGRWMQEVARREAEQVAGALAQERRAEDLQQRLDDANAIAQSQVLDMQRQESRLAVLDAALESAKALASERLEAMAEQESRLGALDAALASAQALALERLQQLGELDAAHAHAQRLALERQAQLDERQAQLEQMQAELDAVRRTLEEVVSGRWHRIGRTLRLQQEHGGRT